MPEDVRHMRTFCRVCEPACGLVARGRGARADRPAARSRASDHARHSPATRASRASKSTAIRIASIIRCVAVATASSARAGTTRSATSRRGCAGSSTRTGPARSRGTSAIPAAFNTLAGPAVGAFFAQLGARRAFSSGTQDCANKFAGSEAVFGSSTIHPIPDLAHTECLLVIGANPRVSHGSFISIADPMRELREARARGAKIWLREPAPHRVGRAEHRRVGPDPPRHRSLLPRGAALRARRERRLRRGRARRARRERPRACARSCGASRPSARRR